MQVVVGMGGDFLKNDKRTDVCMTNARNRSKAVVLFTHLLRQMLMDRHQSLYLVLVSVADNESRAKDEIAWVSEAVTDHSDPLIDWMIEACLKGIRASPSTLTKATSRCSPFMIRPSCAYTSTN